MATRKKKGEVPAMAFRPEAGPRARWIAHPNPLRLLTLGAEHGAWEGGPMPDAHGAILRIVPPADATDESIGGVLDRCRALGVLATKLAPRAAGDVVVVPEVARAARRRHRDVVNEMAAEAVGVDVDALVRAVGEVMDEEGL